MEEITKNCVFACFANGELKGFRQDTFGNLGTDWAKIYGYTASQVEIIKKNTKSELERAGTSAMKAILAIGAPVNTEGQPLNKDSIIEQVEKGEEEKRSWGDFELRVYEIPFGRDEWEKWKWEAFVKALPTPLETHKFTTLENEN